MYLTSVGSQFLSVKITLNNPLNLFSSVTHVNGRIEELLASLKNKKSVSGKMKSPEGLLILKINAGIQPAFIQCLLSK